MWVVCALMVSSSFFAVAQAGRRWDETPQWPALFALFRSVFVLKMIANGFPNPRDTAISLLEKHGEPLS